MAPPCAAGPFRKPAARCLLITQTEFGLTRNPTKLLRVPRLLVPRIAERLIALEVFQPPPRRACNEVVETSATGPTRKGHPGSTGGEFVILSVVKVLAPFKHISDLSSSPKAFGLIPPTGWVGSPESPPYQGVVEFPG